LAIGLVMVVRGPGQSTAATGTPAGGRESSGPGQPIPTVARVTLSAGGTPSSPVVWQIRLGRDGNRNAVLLGYEAYLGTTVRLGEEPDPDDVALAQVALDPQLRLLRSAFAGNITAGTSRRGRVLATARVAGLRGSQAIVVSCVNTSAQRLFRADGGLMAHWHGGLSVSQVNMRRDDGRWKVYLLAALPASRCRA
jgi:hypothetical protein